MASKEKVIHLLITLADCHPEVWRRVVVAEKSSLYDLHLIIQVIMGWTNSHLHEFMINDIRYSDPNLFGMADEKPKNEKRISIKKLNLKEGDQFTYTYDFGDDWCHSILVEKIDQPLEEQVYPVCLGGERANPPEDCGGPFAYEMLLQALQDGNPEQVDLFIDDEDFFDLLETFDPQKFNLKKVNKNLAKDGKILLGKDGSTAKVNKAHQESLLEDFVEELYGKFSIQDESEDLKRLCLDLGIRKDIIVLLKYLSKNRVVGTRTTGNFPLKNVREICANFDPPIAIDRLFVPVRSEDDVFRLQMIHILANKAGLIIGDNGIKWEVTAMGKAFLEVTPVTQVAYLLYNWFMNFGWFILFPLDFSDADEYTKFVVTCLAGLINLEVDEFVPVSTLSDQILEKNREVFTAHFDALVGSMLKGQESYLLSDKYKKGKEEIIRDTANVATQQMVIYPMLLFGILEAIPLPENTDSEHEFTSICLTEEGEILLEHLWKQFEE